MVMTSPSPQQVGREFVRQYYTVLHEAPDMLHRFYSSGSTFVHGGVDKPGQHIEEPVVGQLEIDKKIRALNFKDCHTKIRQVDSQSTIGSGVVVQVTGELSNNGEPMRRFMQTFVLAPQNPKKYYVHNDIFRYQDEVYQDISDAESEEVETTSALPTPPQSQPQSQPQAPSQAQPTVTEIKSTTITDSYFQTNSPDSGLVITQQHQQENQHVVLTSPVEATLQASVSPSPEEVELTAHNHHNQPEPVELKPVAHATEPITEKQKSTESSSSSTEPRPNSWAKIITNKEGVQVVSGAAVPAAAQAAQQVQAPVQPQSQRNKENKPPKANGATTAAPQSGAPKPQRTPNNSASANQVQSVPVENTNGTLTSSAPLENGAGLSNGTIEDLEKRFGRYSDGQQIFVGNLSPDLSDAELRAFFGQYGRVVEIRINTNQKQQSGRRLPNYGFVVFEDKHAVDQLLGSSKSNNLTYKNEKGEYRLNVEEKRARQGRQSMTGGGGGYSGKGGNRAANRSNSNGSRGASVNKIDSGVSAAKKPYHQTNEFSNYAGEGRRAGGANRRS